MTEPMAARALQGCGLPQAWAGQDAWRILETRFDRGRQFLSTWRAWKNDSLRPRLLHYVSLTSAPVHVDDLLACAAPFPELLELAQTLAPQWFGLLPGFHRLTLEDGQVLLTLCVGDTTTLLREQQFLADSIYLEPDPAETPPWNSWTVKALARCCRRGTSLGSTQAVAALRADLIQCGFELQSGPTAPQSSPLSGQFNPRWTLKTTRNTALSRPVAPASCAVIGAGLAGASVAMALARRGWQVQVLDQADTPAFGASGLPVGLVVPHVSADDCPLSRLSRSGVRLMLQQARSQLKQGQDWDATGTLERRIDHTPGLPASWSGAGLDWSQTAAHAMDAAAWNQGVAADEPAIWHRQAAWIKPASLVRAWLAQPGITFQGGARVAAIRQSGDEWELLDASGQVLARASRVVFANARDAVALIESLQTTLPDLGTGVDQLPVIHGVRGQLSWALHDGEPDPAFPPFPVNGSGAVVPRVPVDGGQAWFVGSSYQPDTRPTAAEDVKHAANLGRLQKLLPHLAQVLAQQLTEGPRNAWINTRCVTADRLPMVGPLYQAEQPGLWICAGMGSRGLSFSVLCAELLAARWAGEPLPIEATLAQSLTALRGKPASPG